MSLLRVLLVGVTVLAIQTAIVAQQLPHPATTSADSAPSVRWRQDAVERLDGAEAAARQVLVKFKSLPGVSEAHAAAARRQSILEVVRDEDIKLHRPVGSTGAVLFESRSRDVAQLRAEIASRKDIEYVEPNYRGHQLTTIPNDPDFSQQWALYNTGQVINGVTGTAGADIGAAKAWDITTGSKANVVAIIDSGIYPGHPDLVGNLWSSPKAFTVNIGGNQYTCAIGAEGFDTLDKPESCLTSDIADYYNGHGTAVAGIIGATGNNSTGIAGVNWVASMMIVRAIASDGSLNTSDAVDAINFVVQAKTAGAANVQVINASWFQGNTDLPSSEALYNEVMQANSKGILFVAAAGNATSDNDTYPTYPSNFANPNCVFPGAGTCYAPNVISVAMTNNQDVLDPTSNYGAQSVTLGAPGVSIYSTLLNNGYGFEGASTPGTGTSFAAPQVSGSAALLLSGCPGLSTAQVKADILSTVDQKASLEGKTITGGRVDVYRATKSCNPGPGTVVDLHTSKFQNPWLSPNNIKIQDGISAGLELCREQTSDVLRATNFGFSVGSVTGIQVRVKGSRGYPLASYLTAQLVKGGQPYGSQQELEFPLGGLAFITFGGTTDLWGGSWSPSDINSPNFGVQFVASGGPTFCTPPQGDEIDYVEVTVY